MTTKPLDAALKILDREAGNVFRVERVKSGSEDGFDQIIPNNVRAASISLFGKMGENLLVVIGENTHYELRWDADTALSGPFPDIISAVIAGRFVETIWRFRGEPLYSVGKLFIDGRWKRSAMGVPFLYPPWLKHVTRYAPYQSGV